MSTLFDLGTLQPNFDFPAAPETSTPIVIAPNAYERAILLARRYEDILAAGLLDQRTAIEIGNDIFGGTIPKGAWKVSTAYNAIEAAIAHIIATDPSADPATLLDRVPTQTRRTTNTTDLQQYSTPPTIGAVAAALATIADEDIVCEPSCGTGLLASFARRVTPNMILNEIDPERRALAAHALDLPTVMGVDAKELPLFYNGMSPTVVIANPPFSSDGNLEGSDVATRHLAAAFSLLPINGRLVAIVGQFQHPSVKPELWAHLFSRGILRYACAIDGSAYRRFGTSIDVAIIVIDKNVRQLASTTTVPFPPAEDAIIDPTPRALEDVLATLPDLDRHCSAPIIRTSLRGEKRGGQKAKDPTPWSGIISEPVAPLTYRLNTEPRNIPNDAVWVPYVPTLIIDGAKPHPEQLDEPAALASVPRYLPDVTVTLPTRCIEKGILSDVQLESIVYAIDATDRTVNLQDSEGRTYTAQAGHVFGHGTGVGKGRIIAGTILSRVATGAKKFLWISENIDLLASAQRDWDHVAGPGHESALFSINAVPPNTDIAHKNGVGFTTFSTLRVQETASTRSRFDQLKAWGSTNIDSIFIDESHNAQNATGTGVVDDKTTSSLQGRTICQLQEQFPNARIFYVSATSITKIDAFSYMERLGLWGPDTDFGTREAFLASVEAGKLGALELFCRELRSQGIYQSASLSSIGITTETLVHRLTEDQCAQYNVIAGALRIVNKNAREALDITNANGRPKGRALSQLAIMEQKVLQGVLISMRVGTMIEHIEGALKNGKAIVIQTAATGEAAQKRAVSKDPTLEDLDLSPRELITQYLDRAFPVQAHRIEADDNGKQTMIPIVDADGLPVLDPAAVELREQVKADLKDVLVPDSAINIIINHFGVDNVAECTGRQQRLITITEDGVTKRVLQRRPPASNNAETEAFQSGKKMILIFSEQAGGTGRSFHSDRSCANQAQRYHYAMHVGWSSAKARQARGRTDRTNQACKPHYIDVITDAPGERRFISTTSRNNATIGASTQGQRNAVTTGLYCADANLETEYGQEAVNALIEDILNGRIEKFRYATWLKQASVDLSGGDDGDAKHITVRRFLNRVLCCDLGPNSPQEFLFDAFNQRHEEVITKAKERGTYDAGIQAYPCTSARIVSARLIQTDELTGARTELLDIDAEVRREVQSFSAARNAVRRGKEQYKDGYFTTDDDGHPIAVYKTAFTQQINNKTVPEYGIQTPFTRHWTTDPPRKASISESKAQELWDELAATTELTQTKRLYLLIGPVRRVYRKLGSSLQVVRITLDNGKTHLGVLLESPYVALHNLGMLTEPEDILNSLRSKKGKQLMLKDALSLQLVKYGGDEAVELCIPQWIATRYLSQAKDLGLIFETQRFKQRIFVPDDKLAAVIAAFPPKELEAA
jgi:hypothetical protein